ncbi:MAG: nitroreductase family protein [Chloroflexales bacterium]|nr:nitroreductase family protein [Chloroflexales bacterium]
MDLATVDHLLTTTRSVRKRLDLKRPVEADVIERCLEIAIQSPTGSNLQGWHFLVVTDPALKMGLAELYRQAFYRYVSGGLTSGGATMTANASAGAAIRDSATYLAEHLQEVPVLVLPCVAGRVENAGVAMQASLYGSIFPAVWSFMLALRARGLGSVLTTLHLGYEREAAQLLDIPDNTTQVALVPVAYFTGADFKLAQRKPVREITYWNGWERRE